MATSSSCPPSKPSTPDASISGSTGTAFGSGVGMSHRSSPTASPHSVGSSAARGIASRRGRGLRGRSASPSSRAASPPHPPVQITVEANAGDARIKDAPTASASVPASSSSPIYPIGSASRPRRQQSEVLTPPTSQQVPRHSERSVSPIRGPSSAAAAAAAAAKALRRPAEMIDVATFNGHRAPYYANYHGPKPCGSDGYYGGRHNHGGMIVGEGTRWPDEEDADAESGAYYRYHRSRTSAAYRHNHQHQPSGSRPAYYTDEAEYRSRHLQPGLYTPNDGHPANVGTPAPNHYAEYGRPGYSGEGYSVPPEWARARHAYAGPQEESYPPTRNEYFHPVQASPDRRGSGSAGEIGDPNRQKLVIGGASRIYVPRGGMSSSPSAGNGGAPTNGVGNESQKRFLNHSKSTRRAGRQKSDQGSERSGTNASSVFRGRSANSTEDVDRKRPRDDDDDDSPHRILLSLRTPTRSFDDSSPPKPVTTEGERRSTAKENMGKRLNTKCAKIVQRKKSLDDLPSPPGPPKIQHAHCQSRGSPNLYFDPMRSPQTHSGFVQDPGIESAPSFTLFNQSFDSLVDSTPFGMPFRAMSGGLGSFGMGVASIKSKDEGAPPAARSGPYLSGGIAIPNNSLRLSGSGSIDGGIDPTRSFGEQCLPQAVRKRRTMVLDGSQNNSWGASRRETRTILEGNTSREVSTDDKGASIEDMGSVKRKETLRARSGSVSDGSLASKSRRNKTAPENFNSILKLHKEAFAECSYLLPVLKGSKEAEAFSSNPPCDGKNTKEATAQGDGSPVEQRVTMPKDQRSDLDIARRRVKSAICAFGGWGYQTHRKKDKEQNTDAGADTDKDMDKIKDECKEKNEDKDKNIVKDEGTDKDDIKSENTPEANASKSIFRVKDEGYDSERKPRTLTDATLLQRSEARRRYDMKLPDRYFENENRLSWEVEDDPPVCILDTEQDRAAVCIITTTKQTPPTRNDGTTTLDRGSENNADKVSTALSPSRSPSRSDFLSTNHESSNSKTRSNSPQPKMRYRCKLCGQPKQNHICPYQQSLQRSIGTMVYPAVNAFAAVEPGHLAPPLSAMNNFVGSSEGSDAGGPSHPSSVATTPSRASVYARSSTVSTSLNPNGFQKIIPDSLCSNHNSPGGSSLSTTGDSPPHGGGALTETKSHTLRFSPESVSERKRCMADSSSANSIASDTPFVEYSNLKPDQYRAVSIVNPFGVKEEDESYQYASLPVTYSQRKRLADNLLSMSKEVPILAKACAEVLREAKEHDQWDRAVAELLTQVLVVLHCASEDRRLDGIQSYLLTVGIAC